MNLADLLKKELIFMADGYDSTDAFYADYTAFLKNMGIIQDKENIKRLFVKRENIHSTAIGKGAATPHIFSNEFKGSDFVFSIALIKNGLDFKAQDQQLVYVVFLIMSDERQVSRHLKTLSRIARLVNSTEIIQDIKNATSPDHIQTAMFENEQLIKCI
jgi:mannitol/fructose-specific phosphotransferase system IIA component (Ntr-type)